MTSKLKDRGKRTYGKDSAKPPKDRNKRTYGTPPKPGSKRGR